LCRKHDKKIIVGTGLLTGMSDMQGPSIAEVMDYGYLRSMGVEAFLLSSSNANNQTQRTIEFMNEFE
jgi:pyruvate kinase